MGTPRVSYGAALTTEGGAVRHVMNRIACAAVGAALGVSGWLAAPATAMEGSRPGVSSRDAGLLAVSVPIDYAYELWTEDTTQHCYSAVVVRFGDVPGHEPDHLEGPFTPAGYPASSYFRTLTAPYQDALLFHGSTLVAPGQHKHVLTSVSISASSAPVPAKDCTAERAEQQQSYGQTTTVYYRVSAACAAAQAKVDKLKGKVKGAKRAVRHASTTKQKRQAKRKLAKAKKKLKKAKKRVHDRC